MKSKLIFTLMAAVMMASCSEKELGESILDTSVNAVDKNKATYEFDQWLYDNFVVPYNVDIQYQFSLISSDMNYKLSPADYGKSQLLSHFIRHLFFDVYSANAPEGELFMKKYAPRMFHFVGSSGFSELSGAETLGTAAGGVKITLYCVNEMKAYSKGVNYDSDDIELLNSKFFHTMHHEFAHILHQKKSYPVSFGQVTSSTYDPKNWTERDTTTSVRLGYVTNYASNQNKEDFVETLSCMITDTEWRWMNRIIAASVNGFRSSTDKEGLWNFISKMNLDADKADAHWNNFTVYSEKEYDSNSQSYVETGNKVLDIYRNFNYIYDENMGSYVGQYQYTNPVRYSSFRDFISSLNVSSPEKCDGINALLKKIEISTKWYKDEWGLDVYAIRKDVDSRQRGLNDYINDESKVKIYEIK